MVTKYYRIPQVADILSCANSTVWLYIKQGKLKTIKLSPRVTIIPQSEIERFVGGKV